jgi:4-amino-4-deoxy-L-arabinose transferase-like glycosyltransferase
LKRHLPLLAVLAVSALWLALSPPGANDLVGGDEGYYGTMARNVLASPEQAVSTSLSPLGLPGDKPPLYPLMIAPFVQALGAVPAAVRAPSALCAVVVAWAIGAFTAGAAGAAGALAASLLLVTLPWFADASRAAAAELPLTALASLALVWLARAPTSRARAALSGALLGLAFLCKLWLVAPAALAAAVMTLGRSRAHAVSFAVLTGTALAVAALHLMTVSLLVPQWLDHWLYIYVGRSLTERIAGEGYADYWRQPAGLYWATVTRAFGLLLPFVAAGAAAAWRRRGEPVPRALLVWAAGVLLLSLFRVKSGGYAYVAVPGWAGLAALGAVEWARGERTPWLVLAVGALATSPLVAHWHAAGPPLALWLGVWGAAAALMFVTRARPGTSRVLVTVWMLAAVTVGSARSAQRLAAPFHTPGYERIARAVAPRVADLPPAARSVIAPEAPVFAFHLFRTSGYWGTPITPWTSQRFAELRADTLVRVYVVDPSQRFYGGWPDSATVAWLERERREVPAAAWGGANEPGALRVFVRDP